MSSISALGTPAMTGILEVATKVFYSPGSNLFQLKLSHTWSWLCATLSPGHMLLQKRKRVLLSNIFKVLNYCRI